MTAPTLLQGDCFEVLQRLEADSVDSCVTDPPYGFGDGKTAGFMGKAWDRDVPSAEMWRQVYRVLKPGAHLLSFFGTRTYHRGVVAIEDAGFEIRDQIGWLYGSGFPKSLDVSKAIDKAAGADREVVGKKQTPWKVVNEGAATFAIGEHGEYRSFDITAPATEAAKQWDGWGTALKPAWEPVVVARKPFPGRTVAQNVLEHGTGGLNIDGCRVGFDTEADDTRRKPVPTKGWCIASPTSGSMDDSALKGRWPANVIHDGSDEVLAEFAKYGETTSKAGTYRNRSGMGIHDSEKGTFGKGDVEGGFNDTGTAARFFYTAKASKDDRNDGLHDWEHTEAADMVDRNPDSDGMNSPRAGAGRTSGTKNHHPTVKPTSLMRYLVRLVTPKGGLVLDPFAGSGTTMIAAYREDCRGLGIELDPEYFKMANHRIDKATAQLRLGL